jgi:N-acetylneuraminate synthase
MSQKIFNANRVIGRPHYDQKESEKGNATFRRSLYVVKDTAQGGVFTEQNIRLIRPGFGLAPKNFPDVQGHTVTRAVKRGDHLDWDIVSDA